MKQVSIDRATERKYPEWIMLVVAVDEKGRPNAMAAGWCMFTSASPTMIATSISPNRYTHQLLEDSEDFVLTFPSKAQREAVYFCGTKSGADVDKFSETALETTPAAEVETPLVEDSVACFECRKDSSLRTGDHTIFVGEVVAAHLSEKHTQKLYTVKNWAQSGAEGFKALDQDI
ncbi:MAG: flavin reductase family protein [Candidatus Bipolaricaulota bacterium]